MMKTTLGKQLLRRCWLLAVVNDNRRKREGKIESEREKISLSEHWAWFMQAIVAPPRPRLVRSFTPKQLTRPFDYVSNVCSDDVDDDDDDAGADDDDKKGKSKVSLGLLASALASTTSCWPCLTLALNQNAAWLSWLLLANTLLWYQFDELCLLLRASASASRWLLTVISDQLCYKL